MKPETTRKDDRSPVQAVAFRNTPFSIRPLCAPLLLPLLALLACQRPTFQSGIPALWIREVKDTPPPPPSWTAEPLTPSTSQPPRWDDAAACFRLAAKNLGVPVEPPLSRLVSGVGFGALRDDSTVLGSEFGTVEEAWVAGAPLVGLRATFHATRDAAALHHRLASELSQGRPCLLSLRTRIDPSGDPPKRRAMRLPVSFYLCVAYGPEHYTLAAPDGQVSQLSRTTLEKHLEATWAHQGYAWSFGFVSLQKTPMTPDLRPLCLALGQLNLGLQPQPKPGIDTGARALKGVSEAVGQMEPQRVSKASWSAFDQVLGNLEASRRQAADLLLNLRLQPGENSRKPSSHPFQPVAESLLRSADNYKRILVDYEGKSGNTELLWGAMGLLRDAALQEAAAGRELTKLGSSQSPLNLAR